MGGGGGGYENGPNATVVLNARFAVQAAVPVITLVVAVAAGLENLWLIRQSGWLRLSGYAMAIIPRRFPLAVEHCAVRWCVCARVCVHACVRACVCVCACMRVRVFVFVTQIG